MKLARIHTRGGKITLALSLLLLLTLTPSATSASSSLLYAAPNGALSATSLSVDTLTVNIASSIALSASIGSPPSSDLMTVLNAILTRLAAVEGVALAANTTATSAYTLATADSGATASAQTAAMSAATQANSAYTLAVSANLTAVGAASLAAVANVTATSAATKASTAQTSANQAISSVAALPSSTSGTSSVASLLSSGLNTLTATLVFQASGVPNATASLYNTAGGPAANASVVWPTVVVSTFNGSAYSGYNATSGAFTVPSAGTYIINAQVDVTFTAVYWLDISLYVNGVFTFDRVRPCSRVCAACRELL